MFGHEFFAAVRMEIFRNKAVLFDVLIEHIQCLPCQLQRLVLESVALQGTGGEVVGDEPDGSAPVAGRDSGGQVLVLITRAQGANAARAPEMIRVSEIAGERGLAARRVSDAAPERAVVGIRDPAQALAGAAVQIEK